MIEITEITTTRRNLIATADNFLEAKEKVRAMGVAFMEDDADYENCADAFMNDGRILAIQPRGLIVSEHALWQAA